MRSNGQLQTRIKNAEAELLKTKAKDKSDSKTIETLTRERDILARRIRDRDDELRGKKKHFDVGISMLWACHGEVLIGVRISKMRSFP